MTIEEEAKKMNVAGIFTTAIVSAIALVIGLFWKDAIQGTVDKIIPEGTAEKLFYRYLAAIGVTIVGTAVIYLIYKTEKLREEKFLKSLHSELTKVGRNNLNAMRTEFNKIKKRKV